MEKTVSSLATAIRIRVTTDMGVIILKVRDNAFSLGFLMGFFYSFSVSLNYVFTILADVANTDITTLENSTFGRHVETTPLFVKSTYFDKPPVTSNLPYTIIYIAIAFAGIIVILCGLFVGIYFHKHCTKQVVIVERNDVNSTPRGYCSLGLDSHRQSQLPQDPTYLEPVSDFNGHYDEIKEQDEIRGSLVEKMSTINETKNSVLSDITSTLPHSESFPFPTMVNRNIIEQFKRNSL